MQLQGDEISVTPSFIKLSTLNRKPILAEVESVGDPRATPRVQLNTCLNTCGVRDNVGRDWELRQQQLHDEQSEQEYAKYLAMVAAFEGREEVFVDEVKTWRSKEEDRKYYFMYPFSADVCRAEMRRLTGLSVAFTLGAAIL